MTCPYCNGPVSLTSGAYIYPHRKDLAHKQFYACMPCHAWVGCHPGTITPLGRIADAELRAAKSAAHAAFDPIWQSGKLTRHQAYRWLAWRLGIPVEHSHIGMFDVDTCRRTVIECRGHLCAAVRV